MSTTGARRTCPPPGSSPGWPRCAPRGPGRPPSPTPTMRRTCGRSRTCRRSPTGTWSCTGAARCSCSASWTWPATTRSTRRQRSGPRRADAERDRLLERLRESCALIDSSRPALDVARELVRDHPDRAGVLEAARYWTTRALDFTRERDLVPYHDGTCVVEEAPESR